MSRSKVFITELWQLDTGVDPFIGVIGDYYAKVTINGVEQRNDESCNDESSTSILVPLRLFKNFSAIPQCSARTPWVFSQQVPPGAPVRVKIQIFDVDTIFDDEMDLKPGSGSAIEFTVSPTTGQWTGDVNWPQICSRPNLEQGGSNANVCWQAGFDSDEDGLLDGWELLGVDTDNDGFTDINLPGLGANPLRKDFLVEADYLFSATHLHAPKQEAISQIVTAFANGPLGNLDGTTGAQLHVDVGPLYGTGAILSVAGAGGAIGTYGDLGGGSAIGETGNETIDTFYLPQGNATKFADLKAANFNAAREYVFRYAIFGHQTNARVATNDCTTGQANPNRRDFLVTLGGIGDDGLPCWDTDNGFRWDRSHSRAGRSCTD